MKKFLSLCLTVSLIVMSLPLVMAKSDTNIKARQVEKLTRGGYGVAVSDGIYLSWRLLGTEPISQTFDIYRNDTLIVSGLDSLNYTDKNGKGTDTYKVVPAGEEGKERDEFVPLDADYLDVMLDKPQTGSLGYPYEVHDASCGDVDNDGEYELIIKWEPSNYKDNETEGYTDNVYIDCYELSGGKRWRIDLGKNIRAGSHYTQFIVYDFDGDGKAEMALRTAPGSKDSEGNYVSEKAASIDGEDLIWTDSDTGAVFTDTSDMRNSKGRITQGPDWLTMFNGETGEAMQTVNYYPQRGNINTWGDNYGNRSERFLAGVAYLNGETPSLIMSRGYYKRAAMAAYDWDGKNFSLLWTRDDTSKKGNLYGNGNHQLSVCDADNDGKDEIVFGSTVVDDDGSILNSTDHGHGDALHVSDFDNDGNQEIFQVHEDKTYTKEFGAELREASDASIITKLGADNDVGRGIMGNIDDSIGTSEFCTSAHQESADKKNKLVYNTSGEEVGILRSDSLSFLVWWDGDLGREVVYKNKNIIKYDIGNRSKSNIVSFSDIVSVSKDGPLLSLDLFGDWREELCYPTEDNETVRIYMTTTPTSYKIPTLMHDTQYRTAVAWQNVGYNQPPHTKFYIGKAALAANGKYLAPAAGYDTVTMAGGELAVPTPLPTIDPTSVHTVNIKATGDTERTLGTYKNLNNMSSLSYSYPRYIISGTTAYETVMNTSGSRYGGSLTNIVKSQDIEINYKKKYTNVVCFDDLDESSDKGANVRASNGLARNNSPYTSEYKLQPGKVYTIVIGYFNASRGSQFVADGKELLNTSDTEAVAVNNWGTHRISGVTVENESALYTVAGSKGAYDPIDTIVIIEDVSEKVSVGDVEFGDESVKVLVDVKTAEEINVFVAVYDSYGELKSVKKQSEILSGEREFNIPYSAAQSDGVAVYVWGKNQIPYHEVNRR